MNYAVAFSICRLWRPLEVRKRTFARPFVMHANLSPVRGRARVASPHLRAPKEKSSSFELLLVRETGLEPVRWKHTPLKRARLPIPPLPRQPFYYISLFFKCQPLFSIFLKVFLSFLFGVKNSIFRRFFSID